MDHAILTMRNSGDHFSHLCVLLLLHLLSIPSITNSYKMASGALFGNTTGRSQSKNLVEFRAGKMYMKGKTVHPDKRKGLVYVYQSDDSLMHFCWKDRSKGSVEDDLIIFPDDIEFKRVAQCTTGRVYLLRFNSSNRKFFFWLQEPKTDKDEEHCKKVNEVLNNPPTPGSSRGGSGGGSGGGGFAGIPPELAAGLGEGDLQNLLGNMSQQQLMQLLGGMGMGVGGLSSLMGGGRPTTAQSDSTPPSRVQSSPGVRASTTETPAAPRPVTASSVAPTTTATTTPAASGTTSSGGGSGSGGSGGSGSGGSGGGTAAKAGAGAGAASGIQLSDLQNILSGLGGEGGAEGKETVDLSRALTPEAMIPILANAEVQARLLPFLPEGEALPKTEEELRNTVKSPQFQQAMASFSAALASGQLGPLMGQFNLGEDVANAAAQGDVEAFVKAMQASLAKKEKDEQEKMEG